MRVNEHMAQAEETIRQTVARVWHDMSAREGLPFLQRTTPVRFGTMSKAERQAAEELRHFLAFAQRVAMPIRQDSIMSREPPEPDILCHVDGEGPVAFELKEFCDPHLAATESALLKRARSGTTPEAVYLRLGGASPTLLRDAKRKRYETPHPIELLFYSAGRVVCVPEARPRIWDAFYDGLHQFRRVWYMDEADATCECVYDRHAKDSSC